jgi:hypothetical protein
MSTLDKKTLYIFIDESGNFDFTSSGTKYFVLTAVSTFSPFELRGDLFHKAQELKYIAWEEGRNGYYFHATEDKQKTRDWVFSAIKKLRDIEIDAVVVQKSKAAPSLYFEEEKFYGRISEALLEPIFARHHEDETLEKIVVVLGSLFTDKKRGHILQSLKQYLKTKSKKLFHIYFHTTSSDINCQIADYCSWAIYVKYERGEGRPWEEIKDKIKSCLDVFRDGTKI